MSNKRRNLVHKGTSPSHLSYQKKVLVPFPTFFDTLSANQSPSTSPTPSLIFATSRHQDETLRPPTSYRPVVSPYRVIKTLYHNPPLSTNIRQHHLPNRALLNSCNFLTPNPPYSLRKKIELQVIQEIFLLFSLPPQIYFFLLKIDSMMEIIPGRALKKERA